MKRVIRERYLTPEEAVEDQAIRDEIAEELPDLVARHHAEAGEFALELNPRSNSKPDSE